MTISDRLAGDDEYQGLFLNLIQREAEIARLDGEELRAHGFAAVEVVGLKSVVWQRDGRYFTTDRALAEIRPVITDPKEEE